MVTQRPSQRSARLQPKKNRPPSRSVFCRNWQRPTFPGSLPPSIISAEELNYCVRDGNRCDLFAIATRFIRARHLRGSLRHCSFFPRSRISIRSLAHPLRSLSPRTCLRAHFESWYPQIRITLQVRSLTFFAICWPSSRSISIGQLHTLLHFHLRPINVVVSHGPYLAGEISSRGGLRT